MSDAKGDDPENPYDAPSEYFQYRRAPSSDPSIHEEPHMRDDPIEMDPSELTANPGLDPISRTEPLHDRVEHSVWDEPGLNALLAGPVPDEALTYARWLEHGIANTSTATSWRVTLGLAAISGPCSIVGTFLMGQPVSGSAVVLMTLIGPLIEEVMKAAATLWAAEKRPFFFKSSIQILVCMSFSGLCFAAIENLLYINVYIPNPSYGIVVWRWTICVALHVGCALISGVGIAKMWRRTMESRTRPRLSIAAPYMLTAFAVHGIYNFLALFLEFAD